MIYNIYNLRQINRDFFSILSNNKAEKNIFLFLQTYKIIFNKKY